MSSNVPLLQMTRNASDSTRVVLDHSGFPEEMHEHLGAGWHRMYWEPLKKLLCGLM